MSDADILAIWRRAAKEGATSFSGIKIPDAEIIKDCLVVAKCDDRTGLPTLEWCEMEHLRTCFSGETRPIKLWDWGSVYDLILKYNNEFDAAIPEP